MIDDVLVECTDKMSKAVAHTQAEFASVIANASLDTTPASHQIVVQSQLAF